VRAPVEVDFVLAHNGELIWVESSDKVRYERSMNHRREGEAEVSLKEFKRQEALQWRPQPDMPPKVQMNISYIKAKATKVLVNNSNDMDDFLARGRDLVKKLEATGLSSSSKLP
jgi:hypothetical protein